MPHLETKGTDIETSTSGKMDMRIQLRTHKTQQKVGLFSVYYVGLGEGKIGASSIAF